MLTTKFFKDGDRVVIVLEGLDMPDQETVIKGLLSSIVGTASLEPEGTAVPVPAEEPDVPAAIKEEPEPEGEAVFLDGPYKGMTPEEALVAGKAKAFVYLTTEYVADNDAIGSAITSAVNAYLHKFDDCNAKEYASRLSDKQVATFLAVYAGVIPEDIRKGDDNREVIASAIEHFKTL